MELQKQVTDLKLQVEALRSENSQLRNKVQLNTGLSGTILDNVNLTNDKIEVAAIHSSIHQAFSFMTVISLNF